LYNLAINFKEYKKDKNNIHDNVFYMTISKRNKIILLLLAGILNGIAYNYFIFWLSWFSLIPFFLSINNEKPKTSFLYGFSTGIIVSIFLATWIIGTTQRFTGSGIEIGIVILVLSILYFSFWWGFFAYLFNKFTNTKSKASYHLQVLFGAALWTLLEFIRGSISWYHYIIAHTQTPAPIMIQISSITGVWGISFFIVLVNLYLYYAIITKEKKYLYTSLALFGSYILFNAILMNLDSDKGKAVKFALLQENIDAETRWMPETGDSLANIYAQLAEEAAKANPDFIIWSEDAIPWAFSTDDDLLKMVLSKTVKTGATHLLGVMYPIGNNKYTNSVLLVEANGRITGRYEKQTLIPIAEKPLLDLKWLKLEFFRSGLNENLEMGNKRPLLQSKGITFGTMICNESLIPINFDNSNVNILLSLSNDAWFEGTMLPYHHFYISVLRAVENNKYFVINSNRGFSGIINDKGIITAKKYSKKAEIITGFAYPIRGNTFYSKFGNVPVITLFFLIIIIFVKKIGKNK